MVKKSAYIIVAAFVILAALLYSAFLFVSFAAETGAMSSSGCGSADAIVVLTGGKGRADVGLRLLKKGNARFLILSGVNKDADLDSIYLKLVSNTERANIILDKESTSTYRNAVEVRGLMRRLGARSMLLLTSGYHMKRAEYIFRRIMPDDISITPCSVASPNFDHSRWWGGTSLLILLEEFVKYYSFVAGFNLGII